MAFERPNRRQRRGGRGRPVEAPQRGAPARRLRAADPGRVSRPERRRSPGDGPQPPLRLRRRLRAAATRTSSAYRSTSGPTPSPAGRRPSSGLAIALGTRAKVLLLDEPLANLDPLARREFIQVLIDAMRSDGSTALLSSHIVTDVEEACDRLVILGRRQGPARLPARGSPTRPPADRGSNSPPPGGDRHRLVPGQGRGRRLTLWRLAGGRAAPTRAPAPARRPRPPAWRTSSWATSPRGGATGLQLN